MSKRKTRTPSYRHHKSSGQAVASLNGRDFYLGKYGTDASRAEYDRLIAEWLVNGRRLPRVREDITDYTITEVLAAYWKHAERYYVKDGRPTSEIACIKQAVRPLKRLYGHTPASDFGPLALKAVRQALIDDHLSRNVINKHVSRVKRAFKWAAENELIAPSFYHGLASVDGLRRGRTDAKETTPITAVPDEHVDAIRPHVIRHVWAIIELQRLTGMRSGEVIIMRGRDLDTTGPIWLYRPESHKTQHHGHERVAEIGPRAQEVIRPFLKPDLKAYLFSPADAESERRAELHRKRKTAMSCGNRPGTNRKRKPQRIPRERYTSDSYRRAITRGCDQADLAAKKRQDLSPDSERIIPRWHPHQLRHNYATRVRREYGIETARILLGHRSIVTTEIYAEVDRMKARDVVAKIG